MATRPQPDTQANLTRARDALDALIKKGGDHAWARFYDAMRFVPGLEDAAADQLTDTLHDMGLDEEGYPVGDYGWRVSDCDREYVPMCAIYMARAAA